MARKLTDLQKEYRKQRQRVQRAIKRAEQAGYITTTTLPEIPKRITQASVRRLQKITPASIRKKSTFVDISTGEVYNPRTQSKQRQKEIQQLARQQYKESQETRRKQRELKEAIKQNRLEQERQIEEAKQRREERERKEEELRQRLENDKEFRMKQQEEFINSVIQRQIDYINGFPPVMSSLLSKVLFQAIDQIGVVKVAEALLNMDSSLSEMFSSGQYSYEEIASRWGAQLYRQYAEEMGVEPDELYNEAVDTYTEQLTAEEEESW